LASERAQGGPGSQGSVNAGWILNQFAAFRRLNPHPPYCPKVIGRYSLFTWCIGGPPLASRIGTIPVIDPCHRVVACRVVQYTPDDKAGDAALA
jgi:hypothetical protein